MSRHGVDPVEVIANLMPKARELGVEGCDRKAVEAAAKGDQRGYRLWVAAMQLVAWETEP